MLLSCCGGPFAGPSGRRSSGNVPIERRPFRRIAGRPPPPGCRQSELALLPSLRFLLPSQLLTEIFSALARCKKASLALGCLQSEIRDPAFGAMPRSLPLPMECPHVPVLAHSPRAPAKHGHRCRRDRPALESLRPVRRTPCRRGRFRAEEPQPGDRRLQRRVLHRQQGDRAAGRSFLRRQGRAGATARDKLGGLGRRPLSHLQAARGRDLA